MNENLIQVLWVEDDPKCTSDYPIRAAQCGLELVPFGCWEEAEKALSSEFKRWSAIILDAKCKYKHDSHDNAKKFLMEAMQSINTICTVNHRILPWYILSGGSEDELNDLILDSREKWDGDWNQKKYYSKDTDREILYQRILQHANISPEMQIRLVYYPDVFKAISNIQLDSEIETYMEELLLPIHFQSFMGKEYNENMTKIRKCIELIFQSMAQYGILPNKKRESTFVLHDILMDTRGGINTSWCCKILAGIDVKCGSKVKITSNNILPNVLKDSFHRLTEIAAAYEHAENRSASDEQLANTRQTSDFLNSINNAPYLLRGMVMELCDIILWYDFYLYTHDDEEINALEWNIKDAIK